MLSIGDIPAINATQHGDRPAFLDGDRSLDWQQFNDRAYALTAGLHELGISNGDRIAFLGKNSVEHFEIFFAAASLGAVIVPLNWRLSGRELVEVLIDSQAICIVVAPEYSDMIEDVLGRVPDVRHFVTMEREGTSDRHTRKSGLSKTEYSNLLRSTPLASNPRTVDRDDVVLQIYTSGTTGQPKGVMLTSRNLELISEYFMSALGFSSESSNVIVLPLFHIGGFAWALAGISAAGCSRLVSDFHPSRLLSLMKHDDSTHFAAVPIMLERLLDAHRQESIDAPRLEVVAFGGAPSSADLTRRLLNTFDCQVVQFYGQTEVCGFATKLSVTSENVNELPETALGSCGQAFPHVELSIRDPESGTERDQSEVGEVWLRSDQVMAGYWNNPQDTAKTITTDGWLRTGDAGFLDDAHRLHLVDRVKDMIISGGENIYPAEVELVLQEHPAIRAAAVVGVPSEKWGETVKAVVELEEGATAEESDVVSFCRQNLASYKAPASVDFVDLLPRNATGKILRRAVRERYWKGRERRIS